MEKRLNDWIFSKKPSPTFEPRMQVQKTSHIYKLMKWSAELWFLRQFDSCNDEAIQDWIKEHANTIFDKYFGPIVESDISRSEDPFSIIAENDACDLLRGILKFKNVEEGFKDLLKDWRKVRHLTKDGISKEMVKIVSTHSALYYIIPKRTKACKTYAMHFYMRNVFDVEGMAPSDLGKST